MRTALCKTLLVALSSITLTAASAGNVFGSVNAPVLADFDKPNAATSTFSPILYALKHFETDGWMSQRIHHQSSNGKDWAYYDMYGTDGNYKSYPVWINDKDPAWIAAYALASSHAWLDDPVKNDIGDRDLIVGDYLTFFTGKPVAHWYAKDLNEDQLLAILQASEHSPVVFQTKYGSKDLLQKNFFAVTGVKDRRVSFWGVDGLNSKTFTKELDVKTILNNLDNVGKLRNGEVLKAVKNPGDDWKNHKSSLPTP